jgi:hypothetical protein
LSVLEYILVAILVVAVIAFIAYPLFTPAGAKNEPGADALDNWIAQRDSAYDAIRDLDFDYQMGKLSQSDYIALRNKYRARAAAALEQIDAALGRAGAETRIEEEVTRLRERRRAAVAVRETRGANGDAAQSAANAPSAVNTPGATNGDAIEQEVARLRAGRARCTNCGTPYRSGDRFCVKCGNKLQP